MSETLTGRDVLRLIADGVSVEEIEYRAHSTWDWYTLSPKWYAVDLSQTTSQFRRKPKTRMINGWAVIEPVRQHPQPGQEFFYAEPSSSLWCASDTWGGGAIDLIRLSRGLIFYDRDAAIATAKAMCGINPHAKG